MSENRGIYSVCCSEGVSQHHLYLAETQRQGSRKSYSEKNTASAVL